jgi:hypothetical protein
VRPWGFCSSGEQELERLLVVIARGKVPAHCQAGAPILGIGGDQPRASILEPLRLSELFVEALEAIEGEIGALG